MIYQFVITLLLTNVKTFVTPLPVIFQAQPQVIMHTLQQPIPIETLASLKVQNINQQKKRPLQFKPTLMIPTLPQTPSEVLQELSKIQGMQHSIQDPFKTQSPILTSKLLNQIISDQLHPTNSYLNQEIPIQVNPDHQSMIDYRNQMEENAMQEVALQQQMLALQQMQALKQINTAHSPFGLYDPQPVLILLPDEKENNNNKLLKYTHTNKLNETIDDEESDSVTISAEEEQQEEMSHKEIGMRKAVLLIPNARFSIGGIISQIPWFPIEVNVPDTAIWAWNGIYNGISSIISIIGSNLPFGSRPQESGTTQPGVKIFLKKLQNNNYEPVVPVYAVPMGSVIPANLQLTTD